MWTECGGEGVFICHINHYDLVAALDGVNASSHFLQHVDVSSCFLEAFLHFNVDTLVLRVAACLQTVDETLHLLFLVLNASLQGLFLLFEVSSAI